MEERSCYYFFHNLDSIDWQNAIFRPFIDLRTKFQHFVYCDKRPLCGRDKGLNLYFVNFFMMQKHNLYVKCNEDMLYIIV